MKTKIYNNLIFSLLFVCSIGGLFGGVLFAQGPIVDIQETNAADVELPDNLGNTNDNKDSEDDKDGEDNENETSPPTTVNPAQQSIAGKEPLRLHLYSSIFGAGKEIKASNNDRESVSRTIQGIFGRFFSIIFTLSGILMVILLAVHGTRMIYAEFGGNVAVFSDAKGRVKSAAIGTAILLLSWVILNFIAPSLLRPRLFQTITGLQEVGQGSELYSNNLEIPENGIEFDKSSKKLTITRCPEIVDTNFRDQLNSIKKSLQHDTSPIPLQYSYQVLYTRAVSDRVYTYNEENENEGAKVINCTPPNKPDESVIQLPDDVEIVVAFPAVSIGVEESEKVPNTDQTETKVVQKKFWHGLPWKNKNEDAHLTSQIQSFIKSSVTNCPNTQYLIHPPKGEELSAAYGKKHGAQFNFKISGVDNLKSARSDQKIHFIDHTYNGTNGILAEYTAYDKSSKVVNSDFAFSIQNRVKKLGDGFTVDFYFNKNVQKFCMVFIIPANTGPLLDKDSAIQIPLSTTHCFDITWGDITQGDKTYEGGIKCDK